jgi:hypothetical protein
LSRIIKNTFLIFWTSAVLFICIGSLVNFHQHKIWGKALLPQLLYTNRDKEKSLDLLKSFRPNFSTEKDNHQVVDFAIIQDQPSFLIALLSQDPVTDNLSAIPSRQLLPSLPLRAPPVA